MQIVAKKTLYLANQYGFSLQQKTGPLQDLVKMLSGLGAEVWEPFERNNQNDGPKSNSPYEIGRSDMQDVRDADGIFAVVNGTPPDEGVMVELGMAIAWGKEIFLFRDDFRRCTDSDTYPLNLMLFTGLPKKDWKDWYYTNIDEIADPNKALVRWLKE